MVPLGRDGRAGTPLLAVQNIEDMIPFPRAFVKSENVFLLRVQGDSMIDAGIFDGDYVLVRQQDHAENGDIVVALLGDEATVKVFYKEKDAVRLRQESPDGSNRVTGRSLDRQGDRSLPECSLTRLLRGKHF